jgi:predicted site-specific integrase-resolvase
MDCHRQVMQREQAKAREYEDVIREMSDRLTLMERKNREMREMLIQQQHQMIRVA